MNCKQCRYPLYGKCWVAEDNVFCDTTCFNGFTQKAQGYTHQCPLCKGSGVEYDRDVADVETYDPSGGHDGWFSSLAHRAVIRHERKSCSFCDGRGYLNKKPVPVVEPARVTGWRK
jgi:DnaJ-class molecular chaperone